MNDSTEDVRVHFMVREMPKNDKDAITFYSRTQGMKNNAFLSAMLGLYEDLMQVAQGGDRGAKDLLERQSLSHIKPLLPADER